MTNDGMPSDRLAESACSRVPNGPTTTRYTSSALAGSTTLALMPAAAIFSASSRAHAGFLELLTCRKNRWPGPGGGRVDRRSHGVGGRGDHDLLGRRRCPGEGNPDVIRRLRHLAAGPKPIALQVEADHIATLPHEQQEGRRDQGQVVIPLGDGPGHHAARGQVHHAQGVALPGARPASTGRTGRRAGRWRHRERRSRLARAPSSGRRP